MATNNQLTDHVLDLLAPLGDIAAGRMFGGVGFKHNGAQFAMLMRDTLYFVVDDQTRPKYIAAGSGPFSYQKKDRVQEVKRYYEVPAEILDDPEQLRAWASESIAIAGDSK